MRFLPSGFDAEGQFLTQNEAQIGVEERQPFEDSQTVLDKNHNIDSPQKKDCDGAIFNNFGTVLGDESKAELHPSGQILGPIEPKNEEMAIFQDYDEWLETQDLDEMEKIAFNSIGNKKK